jgi:hypothetical protein
MLSYDQMAENIPNGHEPVAFRSFLPALALLAGSFVLLASLFLTPPAGATQIAAVFSPVMSKREVLAAVVEAGAAPVRQGALSNVMVVAAETDDIRNKLQRAGAWVLLDPIAAGGCNSTQPAAKTIPRKGEIR